MARHVCEGEYSEREDNLCSVYCVSLGFDFMLGGWTSNSGGHCPEAGVVSEVLFVIVKKGENVICRFDDVTNSGTL